MSELTGIELRCAVATEVMGWEKLDRVKCGWGRGPDVYATGDKVNEETGEPMPGAKWGGPTFQGFEPESKIDHAFMVLDKVINDHNGTLMVSIDMLFPDSGDSPDITVSFRDFWESGPVMGHGASTQEAICRAALIATRAKKPATGEL